MLERVHQLIGEDAVRRLNQAHVMLFGLGGVGGIAAEVLIRSGIGTLTIVDGDKYVAHNLNRQIGATTHVLGMYKTAVTQERLLSINPDANIMVHNTFYRNNGETPLISEKITYVVDAIDDVDAKISVIEVCKRLNVSTISCMGTGNKLEPQRLRVCDIYSTQNCPLARVMRQRLRKLGVDSLDVVFSDEKPLRTDVVSSMMAVPATAGILLANFVIKQIIGAENLNGF